ncbi:hypothetical protein NDU88_006477 [Pleurodeles waltl]|uniref:Uncharacterized protein n=1 Tax=Pleurodeles waltl TaxID=8319 RepID=A0AAV7N3L1_PLEWA|nr:hypothetical protein NDU88_006477 [Pleurodeles waltl]
MVPLSCRTSIAARGEITIRLEDEASLAAQLQDGSPQCSKLPRVTTEAAEVVKRQQLDRLCMNGVPDPRRLPQGLRGGACAEVRSQMLRGGDSRRLGYSP